MEETDNVHDTQPVLVISTETKGEQPSRRAALVQLPRRIFLLLLGFGTALLLIWGLFLLAGEDAAFHQSPLYPEELVRGITATLSLLLSSLLVAFILALLLVAVALFERRIQIEVGRAGLLLRFGSRLLMFALLTTPVILLALVVRWLEIANIHGASPGPISPSLLEGLRFPLATLILALLPGLLAAQATTRHFVLSQPRTSPTATLLALLSTLLRQTGGLLSAVTIVEIVFNRPGLGNLLLLSLFHNSSALLPVILSLLALLVLVALLLAELSEWGARLLAPVRKPEETKAQRPYERRLWIGVAMWLLLIPLGLAAGGLFTEPQYALHQNLQAQDEPPSPAHPLGTDAMGRDVWARALRGGLSTVRRGSGVAALSLLPGFFLGLLAGVVSRREVWLRESAADLLLLPLDALLFIPLIPGVMALLLLWGESAGPILILATALLLLPRVARASRALWEARATDRGSGQDLLVGLSALFLGTLFVAFGALTALEFVGLGPQPPLPTLGSLLQNGQRAVVTNPQQVASISIIVAGYSLAFYTGADALLDAFNTKRAMAALNH